MSLTLFDDSIEVALSDRANVTTGETLAATPPAKGAGFTSLTHNFAPDGGGGAPVRKLAEMSYGFGDDCTPVLRDVTSFSTRTKYRPGPVMGIDAASASS